jgi:hypothetical protein
LHVNITRIFFIADVAGASVDAITLHQKKNVDSAERNGAAGLGIFFTNHFQ